nr:RNA polymerase sigma factor [uncultured Merdimonas sp.]
MRCDEATFAQMYESVFPDLYRYAFCILGHPQDAEDAVSEAVMTAYGNIRKLRKPGSFKSWIFTILANICKKRRRTMGREIHSQEDAAAELPDQEVDHAEALDVRRAFGVLTDEEKEIIGLSVFGGYNSREIGQMLGQNANTVRSRRSRALRKMEAMLR